MGTADPLTPTSDFFDTTLAQASWYASKLRLVPTASSVVTKLDELAALCQAAIDNGRKSSDIAAIAAKLTAYSALAQSLPKAVQDSLEASKRAERRALRPDIVIV